MLAPRSLTIWKPGVDFRSSRSSPLRPSTEGGPDEVLAVDPPGHHPTPRDESWNELSQDEQNAVYAAYKEINQNPGVTSGLALEPPEMATTVRVEDGKTLTTDGPFVELKEAVGGYLIFEADDLDAAIELAAKIPAASLGGAIEVRPIMENAW